MSRALLIVMACLVVAASANPFEGKALPKMPHSNPKILDSTKIPTLQLQDLAAKLPMPKFPSINVFGDLSKITMPDVTGRRLEGEDEDCHAAEIVTAAMLDDTPEDDDITYLCGNSDCQATLVDLAGGEITQQDLSGLCNIVTACDMNFTAVMTLTSEDGPSFMSGAFHEHPLCTIGACADAFGGLMSVNMTDEEASEAMLGLTLMCDISEGCGSPSVVDDMMDQTTITGDDFHEHPLCAEDGCLGSIIEAFSLMEDFNETTAAMMGTGMGALCDNSEFGCMDMDGGHAESMEDLCDDTNANAGVCTAVMATMMTMDDDDVEEEDVYGLLGLACFELECAAEISNITYFIMSGDNDTAALLTAYPCLQGLVDADEADDDFGENWTCTDVPTFVALVSACDDSCIPTFFTMLAHSMLCTDADYEDCDADGVTGCAEAAMVTAMVADVSEFAPEPTQSDRAAAIAAVTGGDDGTTGGGGDGGTTDALSRAGHATIPTLALLAAALLAAI